MTPDPAVSEVRLVDAHRVLSLFAEGIAGRYLHLKSQGGLPANLRPDEVPPTSEGFFVYLPDSIDAFPDARANRGLYRAALMHQLGYLEFGTYAFELAEARRRLPELGAREPALGRTWRSDFERFFACFDTPRRLRRVFALFEDDRIHGCLHRTYPGLRGDLDRAAAHALAARDPLAIVDSPGALLEALLRSTLGDDARVLCDLDATGRLESLLELLAPVRAPGADVYTSAAAALACLELVSVPAGSEQWADPGEPVDAASGVEVDAGPEPVEFRGRPGFELGQLRLRVEAAESVLETLEDAGDAISPEALAHLADLAGLDLEGIAEPGSGGDLFATGGATARRVQDLLQRRNASDTSQLWSSFGEVSRGDRSFLYDEWDFHHRTYLRGWCRLYEHPLAGDEGGAFLDSVRARHGERISRVRQRFRHVRPDSYRRVGRVREGEDVDLDSAVEAHVDRRAGLSAGDRVYVRRERSRREVAAAFLLDLSGSVSHPIPDPDAEPPPVADPDDDYLWGVGDAAVERAPERRILDVEKEALALMALALETLGDAYGIYGFSGSGRENVEFFVAKEFASPLRRQVWNAIAAMRPRGSTRMGPAIRHTVRKLLHQDAGRKVLLLVSDGFPQDRDYGPERGDHTYGIRDTAQALREAARAGIQTFCVTVDAAGNDYLREMCPDQQYLVIDEVELLPAELDKVYRALTRRS